MKLLKVVTSMQEANNLSDKLKSIGISTFISNEETKNLFPQKTFMGIVKVGVWVLLDYQYDDAVKVLNDPDHVVSSALTPDEVKMLAKDKLPPYSATTKSIIAWTVKILLVAILLCIISYILRTTVMTKH